MKQTEEPEVLEMIELWKKNNIRECIMEFSCGGDSMNDYSFTCYTSDGKIENDDTEILINYFDIEVFNQIEFYVNSDGHYMGESGIVTINIENDGDDYFTYYKNAESEYSEIQTEEFNFELTDKEVSFINEYVRNINGGDGDVVTNYKKDFIFTEEQEELVSELESKLKEFAYDCHIDSDGEWNDWYTFTTAIDDDNVISIEGNTLKVSVSKTFNVYRKE
jgi:hypothetical protein